MPAGPGDGVEISVPAGRVVVTGWDRPEVLVRAALAHQRDRLEVERHGSRIAIAVASLRPDANRAELQISLPKGGRVEIDVASAEVEVRGVEGELEISSLAGPVEVQGRPRSLDVTSVSGTLTLQIAGSRRVEAESVSGALHFAGQVDLLRADTVAGAIDMRGSARDLDLQTFSGEIAAELLAPPAGTRGNLRTFSGSIVLTVPAQLGARFELHSDHGTAQHRLPSAKVEEGKGALRMIQGDGSASFALESFAGNLEVLAAPR